MAARYVVERSAKERRNPEVLKMHEEENNLVYEGVVVPESALLKLESKNRCGSVDGLDDDELADPEELERQILKTELEPILAIPRKQRRNDIWPILDPSSGVDWGAFGTIDFDRIRPEFDRVRYKADKLREQLKDVLIMLSIVKGRLPGKAKYLVLKYLRMGWIGIDEIANEDMRVIAKWYFRARKLQQQIRGLEDARRTRDQERLSV